MTSVYLAGVLQSDDFPGPIKIGIADNVPSRIAALQTGSPHEIELIGAWVCRSKWHARAVERAILTAFGKSRIRGEWLDEPADKMAKVIPVIIGIMHEVRP